MFEGPKSLLSKISLDHCTSRDAECGGSLFLPLPAHGTFECMNREVVRTFQAVANEKEGAQCINGCE